jgi:glycosyltransferase involved in cell wall biosynthesis
VSQPGSEGVGNYVARMAEVQAERGHRIEIACPASTPLAAAADRSGLVVHPWEAGRNPDLGLAGEAIRLRQIIKRVDPDVVHLHSSKAGLVGRLAVRHRRPTVFQPHSWSFEALPSSLAWMAVGWERLAASWVDVLVGVSEDETAAATERGIRTAGPMVTVPNPVETERFGPVAPNTVETRHVRRSLGLGDEPLVVCVGRLCHQKGQDRLMEIWPRVLERVPSAQLLLVGDGPDRASLEVRAGEQIHFLGDRADVAAILRAAQIAVLASRWEGMSLAVLEALASSIPVVATAVAGSRETVGRGAGAVVDQEAYATMAEEIIARLLDPALARREGATGRRIVSERHRYVSAAEALSSAYGLALAAHRQTGVRSAVVVPGARVDG